MTVGELIAKLSKCELDAEVGVSFSQRVGYVSKIVGVMKFQLDGGPAYAIDQDDACYLDNSDEEFSLTPL